MKGERLYRFLRVLEYVGTRKEIDIQLERRSVKGRSPYGWQAGGLVIYEAVLGDVPQPVDVRWMRDLLKSKASDPPFPDDDAMRQGWMVAIEGLLDEMPL